MIEPTGTKSAPSALASERESDGIFYTNRCGTRTHPGCGRFLTKLEILDALGINPRRPTICPCGSDGFRPSNAKWWEELFLPRSWKLWWAIRNGRVLPPPRPEQVEKASEAALRAIAERMEDYMPEVEDFE